ncbi:MAG: ferredoxin--NADP reductase [Deltaproteobacteria bacterium]|nr:ferredoxin--NADP reductase [Deltaproteobacteria bacterium]
MPVGDLNAVVTKRIDVAPGLMILRVRPDGWSLSPFTPGQYVAVGLWGDAPRVAGADPETPPTPADTLLRRTYSIASSSKAGEYLELYISLVRSGALTPRLFHLQEGDRLWMHHKITGVFTLDSVPEDRDLVLLATGTGLAPYMSMLRSGLLGGGARRYAILLGARHSWDLGYHGELCEWQRTRRNLTYVPTVSRPAAEATPWGGHVGRVQTLWQERVLDAVWGAHPTPASCHVFLCGNPGMVDAMVEVFKAEGFREHSKRAPGELHLERYK